MMLLMMMMMMMIVDGGFLNVYQWGKFILLSTTRF